jgi:hypothetical protein
LTTTRVITELIVWRWVLTQVWAGTGRYWEGSRGVDSRQVRPEVESPRQSPGSFSESPSPHHKPEKTG